MTRRITIDPITRLEGHGRIEVLLDEQGNAQTAFLQVPELRGFERFCVGRAAEEMPQLTAHVCGVCPAAHHLASVRALDALYGATPPVAARRIQALYYNLFLFEDHLLHYWYLGGPDFYAGPRAPAPMRNVLGVIAKVGAALGGRILSVRKEARDLMAAMAGRTDPPGLRDPGRHLASARRGDDPARARGGAAASCPSPRTRSSRSAARCSRTRPTPR